MKDHKPVNAIIPGLGQRSIKTALATALIALIYFPIERDPTFACIGVIFGMGNSFSDSKKSGGNRLIGTIIGGFLGISMFWLEHYIYPMGNYYLKVALVFIGVILLVCSSVTFKWPGAVQPGGVVLCIILFNTPVNHIGYALHRMLDTAIGVIFAIILNQLITRDLVEKVFGGKICQKKQKES